MIGPAERVELIVDFAGASGDSVELRSRPHHGGHNGPGAKPYVGALMQFRVDSGRMPDRTKVPHRLRPLPAWTKHVSKKPDRRWAIEIGGDFTPTWVINGRTFNPARADAFPGNRHDRDLGVHQQDQHRPPDPPPPHRLVSARPRRQDAAALGRLPQGHLLPPPRRTDPGRRPLQRLPRQVRDPLPHARPRGPRPDVPIPGRKARLWALTGQGDLPCVAHQ